MDTEKMIAILENKFPQCWFKEIDGAITSGEEAEIDGLPAFNYNGYDSDPNESIWVMGVQKELEEFVNDLGMYWECQDPGTYKLYEN